MASCASCAEARKRLLEAALSRDLRTVGREAMQGIRLLAHMVASDEKKTEQGKDGTDPPK